MSARRSVLIGTYLCFVWAAAARAQTPLERLEQGLEAAPPAVANDAFAEDAPLPPDVGGQREPVPGRVTVYLGLSAIEDFGGIRVERVVAGGPASRGGLRRGMQMTSVGGHPVTTMSEFADVLARFRPGDAIEFEVDGIPQALVVTVAATADRPASPPIATDRDVNRLTEMLEARIDALEGRVKVLELRIRELETSLSTRAPRAHSSGSPSSTP